MIVISGRTNMRPKKIDPTFRKHESLPSEYLGPFRFSQSWAPLRLTNKKNPSNFCDVCIVWGSCFVLFFYFEL